MKQLNNYDLIVFSHLRWDFVFQRPQHLLTRFANLRRVFYIEEPILKDGAPTLEMRIGQNGVCIVTPALPAEFTEERKHEAQGHLIENLLKNVQIEDFVLWYYTPMAIPFSRHLHPRAVVYDCMDELSLFQGAHPALLDYEAQLFNLADVVFTGGQNLYEYKKTKHSNVHAFPSSIEFDHFHKARAQNLNPPLDQREILGPKLGYYGVIDERMDLSLLDGVAQARPDWQIILLGPTIKIDPAELPCRPNLHYLGQKRYQELPDYLSQWEVALLPFAKNDSTRFISPTKTPEYLAAGIPVVSTSITDVVRPYGDEGLVFIADTVADFVLSIESALKLKLENSQWIHRVDGFLSPMSWDKTWLAMSELVQAAVSENLKPTTEASYSILMEK